MQIASEYNSESCASIPDCVISNSIDESTTYTARSRNWVVSDFDGVEDFQVEIEWKFGINGMKLKRAHKSGGMNYCNFMTFYRHGKLIIGDERRKCIEVIKTRIERSLGIDFTNGILFRSRFVVACAYPMEILIGLDVHHIVADNQTQRRHACLHNINLDESWCRGTDDRLSNLQIVEPKMHKLIHERQGDVWWFKSDKNYSPDLQEEVIDYPLPPANSGFQPPTTPPFGTHRSGNVYSSNYYNCSFRPKEEEVEFLLNLARELGVNLDSG